MNPTQSSPLLNHDGESGGVIEAPSVSPSLSTDPNNAAIGIDIENGGSDTSSAAPTSPGSKIDPQPPGDDEITIMATAYAMAAKHIIAENDSLDLPDDYAASEEAGLDMSLIHIEMVDSASTIARSPTNNEPSGFTYDWSHLELAPVVKARNYAGWVEKASHEVFIFSNYFFFLP